MRSYKALLVVMLMYCIFVLPTSTRPTAAQGVTTSCNDPAFLAMVSADFLYLPAPIFADVTDPVAASASIPVIDKLRYKYEDLAAPAGCESVQGLLINFLITSEDRIMYGIAALTDTANAANYTSFVSSTIAPHLAAISKALTGLLPSSALSATPAVGTNSAATAPAPAAATAAVCPDAAFVQKIGADIGGLTVLSAQMVGNVNAIATAISGNIQLRYKYETVVPSAGCEAFFKAAVQLLTASEDTAAAAIADVADHAHVSTYDDFLAIAGARIQAAQQTLVASFPNATPAATSAQ